MTAPALSPMLSQHTQADTSTPVIPLEAPENGRVRQCRGETDGRSCEESGPVSSKRGLGRGREIDGSIVLVACAPQQIQLWASVARHPEHRV